MITPIESGLIEGKVELPVAEAGRVKVGQLAEVTLDDYPSREYGILQGKVASMANLPLEGFYSLILELPPSLTTNNGVKLPITQKMQGEARIITAKVSVLQRMLNPVSSKKPVNSDPP